MPVKKRKDIEKKLLVKHPISNKYGLYFPFYSVSKINHLKTPLDPKKIFDILVKNYVGNSKHIYKHKWEIGNIIISDQVHSLHRRDNYRGLRELYRTAFWYHF